MQPVHLLILASAIAAQSAQPSAAAKDPETCPLHAQHMAAQKTSAQADTQSADERFAEMNARGAVAMGFDQEKTTHHFRTADDGGAIEVTVNDPQDSANLKAIRTHLQQVTKDFARGDFGTPLATHGEVPAGVEGMQAARQKITYRYEEMAGGARVRIATRDSAALKAVQQFLGYQVAEHRTGDEATKHSH
jgi:hypothetical protein